MPLLLLGLAVLAALYFWKRQPHASRQHRALTGDAAYQRLLRKALGDRAQVERLIEYERQRQPQASRARWIRNALERWERELR